jgi:hypothetical protein
LKSERERNAPARAHHLITGIGSAMLQSTLTKVTHLAHNQRLIDRRKLHAKVRARAIARVNAKRLGRRAAAGARQAQGLPAGG